MLHGVAIGSARQRTPVLGAELVSNGAFGTDTTAWTANLSAALSVVAGEMLVTLGAGSSSAFQDIAVIAGQSYTASVQCRLTTGTSAAAELYGSAGFASLLWSQTTSSATNVTLTGTVVATGPVLRFNLVGNGAIANVSVFDNASVKNLAG